MRRLGTWLIGGLLPLTLSTLSTFATAVEASFTKDVRPLLETYCFTCHNSEKKKADLDLTIYKDDAAASRATKLWRGVIEQVGDHLMPPDTAKKHPSMEEREALVKALKNLKKYDGPADPGRVTIRRLNRTEYDYTIRDLIGIDLRTARSSFPSDDVGEGFDNIGDVLSLPPLLLEKYLDAATNILDKAIVAQPLYVSYNGAQLPAIHEGKAVPAESGSGSRDFTGHGEAILTVAVPADGKYTLKIRVGQIPAGPDPAMLVVKVDNQVVKELKATAKKGNPPSQSVALTLEKGSRRITLHFANPFTEPAPDKDAKPKPGDKKGDDKPAVRTLSIASVELTGGPGGGNRTERNKRIFVAEPSADLKPRDAAVKIVDNFASLAFRRPATKEQIERLLTIFDRASGQGETFDEAITYTLKAVLVSPAFLYRIEADRKATLPNNAYPLDDYELASRLSYFLWSSMPDDELFALAEKKQLAANLELQVRRMLKDPKAKSLVDNFVMQWLQLQRLQTYTPDAKQFPLFTEQVRTAMLIETRMFFEELIREDRPILDIIDGRYTYLNGPLASLYGIKDSVGNTWDPKDKRPGGKPIPHDKFVRVELPPESIRGGILTHASILTVTSNPTRTSPVKRGKWVLEQILGTPPPPPPPDVPELKDDAKTVATGSLRKRMEEHRKNAACANCHAKMDDMGFAFENFNAIGAFRAKDGEFPIEPAGVLPDGKAFKNPNELKVILKEKKELLTRNLAEKLLTYSIGRGLEWYDKRSLDAIVAGTAKGEYRFSALVLEAVRSDPFRMRRGTN